MVGNPLRSVQYYDLWVIRSLLYFHRICSKIKLPVSITAMCRKDDWIFASTFDCRVKWDAFQQLIFTIQHTKCSFANVLKALFLFTSNLQTSEFIFFNIVKLNINDN